MLRLVLPRCCLPYVELNEHLVVSLNISGLLWDFGFWSDDVLE